MATSTESSPLPPPSEPEWLTPQGDEPAPTGRRIGFWVTLAAVALLIGGWAYLLFGYEPELMIDELADKTFPTQAEDVCAATVAELGTLPLAQLANSSAERADTVAESNVMLQQMVDDLRPLAPTSPPKVAAGVQEWLDDWDTYIDNREQYVDNLRQDPDARFLESTKGTSTKGITRAINGFADVNDMVSCNTPADLS